MKIDNKIKRLTPFGKLSTGDVFETQFLEITTKERFYMKIYPILDENGKYHNAVNLESGVTCNVEKELQIIKLNGKLVEEQE